MHVYFNDRVLSPNGYCDSPGQLPGFSFPRRHRPYRDLFMPDEIPLTQINGRPTPLGTIYGLRGLDMDMMAQRTVVIVVDDDPGLLKSVAQLLAHHGIESRTFASAEALLESDSVQTATCLLLDIHLGGISGIELRRRLAASGSKWPVIFMTANDDEATRNEAMDAGCIAYLRKPFAQHVLLKAISKAVL
jgi:CheY-like chemotaxis protein